jgi:ABC-type Fe3+/spermidine/putrescine transport system ATPase subunit
LTTVENISKKYDGRVVLDRMSFEINHTETLSILGRSGCGKTTLLKIIAGLEDTDSGAVYFEGVNGAYVRHVDRQAVYLYQEALLFPHLNVLDNIAFGLRLRNVARSLIESKTDELINELELTEHGRKMPNQLSGGQKQRVAFGRALIIEPRILLLDEPFGNLDSETRELMQLLLKRVAKQHRITSLFVTHDLKEAILMGDRIGYMDEGKLKLYQSKEAFINDPDTGVKEEIEFWKQLSR